MHACQVAPVFAGLLLGIAACGSSSGSACDLAGIETVVGNIVGESGLAVGSIDDLQCAGDWAVATVTVVAGDGIGHDHGATSAPEPVEPPQPVEPKTERFLFHRVEGMWIWKFPETVCGLEDVPAELAVCGTAS